MKGFADDMCGGKGAEAGCRGAKRIKCCGALTWKKAQEMGARPVAEVARGPLLVRLRHRVFLELRSRR